MSAQSSNRSLRPPWRRIPAIVRDAPPPLLLLLGPMLLLRVLTDDRSSPDSRLSGSLNLSGVIAGFFILLAIPLILGRRRGLLPATLAVLWLCIWTAVAVSTRGASSETLREGVREASVVALAAIVFNSRRSVTMPAATRLVQLLGAAPALLALYQIATNTGANIAGELRANGTFAHPNSAAMFFAIAALASLWRYLDDGRRWLDAVLGLFFAAALIATFSIDGLITLAGMLIVFGLLRPGTLVSKLGLSLLGVLVVLAFFATPLGSQRIAKESTSNLAAAERGEANSSLDWRLHKWETLLPEWESSPFVGRGLGITTTVKRKIGDVYTGEPPHNEFLRYLVETGIVGLATLIIALGLLAYQLFIRQQWNAKPRARPANMSLLGIVILFGCLVNSLADNTLLNSPTCYEATLIIIAALALPRIDATRT